jgi:uncharacterized caspase-like protein
MKKNFTLLQIVICILLLTSCVGIQYQENMTAVELNNSQNKEITIKVLAKAEEWKNSGVILKKSQNYKIVAKGRWSGGFGCGWSGPDGIGSGCPLGELTIMSGWPLGMLIGKIGEHGTPFPVGAELDLTSDLDGVLFFRHNDLEGFCGDNNGFLSVKTSIANLSVSNSRPDKLAQTYGVTNSYANTKDMSYAKIGQSWAVIIGISDYKDTRIPSLRYASADAKSFYNWSISQSGGKYAPSRVKLLLNDEATGRKIKDTLYSWLKQALEEDVVAIYFAGHGSPESPDSPGNLYLLPYDTDYQNIASTGFPMWDIETALQRFIKAKKVVVIADACHSGGVGQSYDVARRASRAVDVNPISSGLQNLSQIGDGVCVISASDDKQFSQESKDWGGGHGVFTYFLLEGLNGKADYNKDTNVTLGELIPYLSEQVRRATRNAQSPTVAGKFDPALSIGR